MITIDDNTPNKINTSYIQLQSPEPHYAVSCTTARTLRLPSRGAPAEAGDHHIDAMTVSAQVPLTIIGCDHAIPRFNVPLVGGPVTITTQNVYTFSCRIATGGGYEWVQA